MSFGDEIFRALTGRYQEPTSFGEMFRDLTQYRLEVGMSRRGFAKQYGIPESTLRRWEAGDMGTKGQQARMPGLIRAYRGLISSPAAVERWKANGMTIHVDGVPTRGGSSRTKSMDLDAGRLKLRPGTGDAVVKAFLAGDDKGAARAFKAGIGDGWYRGKMFGQWLADDDLAYEGSEYDGADDYEVTASAT